jgi:hypothetical protein
MSKPARPRAHRSQGHDRVQKIPPGAVLDLDDPDVRIELDLPRQISLRVGLGCVFVFQAADKGAIRWPRLIERALRCRAIDLGGAVKPSDFDEYRTRLVGAPAAQHSLRTFDLTTADIGRYPYAGLETHGLPFRK